MSMRYRLKRSSGPVHEPIPAHPDAIYRPQNRPVPLNVPPVDSGDMAPRLMDENPVLAAPLVVGGSGFPLWWIIGPLLALLAAMAIAALVYAMKKKNDSKTQTEEENDPEKRQKDNKKADKTKEKNSEDDNNTKKVPIKNVPLTSMKPDSILNEQKRSAPMLSAAKGNSTWDKDPLLSNQVNNKQSDKSSLPAHDLSRTNDVSALPSTRSSPMDKTYITKPNSDMSKQFVEKKPSKIAQDSSAYPFLSSPIKHIRTAPTHKTESGNILPGSTISPTSSIASNTQKRSQSKDGSEFNSDTNPNKKEKQANNFERPPGHKSPFDLSSTNIGRVEHPGPLKAGQISKKPPLLSSHSGIDDFNTDNSKPNGASNRKENQTNDIKTSLDDKSLFDGSSTNAGHVNYPGLLKTGDSNEKPSLSSSRSRTNDSNIGISKSDANTNKKDKQADDFKRAPDEKSPFDQSSTNVSRVGRLGPLKAGQINKESSLPSSRSEVDDFNADKLKSNADPNRKENQPNDKSRFDQSLTNVGRVDYPGLLKAGQINNESSLRTSRDGINDLNTDKLKVDTDPHRKDNKSNDSRKENEDKSSLDQNSTNIGRMNDSGLLKAGQNRIEPSLSSSGSGMSDQNATNRPGDDHINRSNSVEEHGVGKSPLVSSIPTGSKRSGKERSQSRTNQSVEEEEKLSSKSSSSNPNLQQQGEHSSKENTDSNKLKNRSSSSDINKDQQSLTLISHSKHDSLSESSETIPSNSVTSPEPTNEKNSASSRPIYSDEKASKHAFELSDQDSMLNKNNLNKFDSHHTPSLTKEVDSNSSNNRLQSHTDSSNPQKSNKPIDDKSDESNTSLTKSDLTNYNKPISLMPNVPQCKTNTSSDDDDYDEVYSISSNNPSIQQTTSKHEKIPKSNPNLNKNASIYRKTRTLHMRKSLTKRFHPKDKP